jgi:hypothetical protein
MKHIPGNKYHHLTLKIKLPKSAAMFSCECGKEKIISIRDVARGKVKSCGCQARSAESQRKRVASFLRTRTKHPEKFIHCKRNQHLLAGFNRLIRICRNRSETNLTPEYLQELLIKQNSKCIFSNLPIYIFSDGEYVNNQNPWNIASIDRIDNSLPYMMGNVNLTSITINYAKNTSSTEDIIEFIKMLKYGFIGKITRPLYTKSDFYLLRKVLDNFNRKECYVTQKDLYDIWQRQSGLCIYSKAPLILKTKRDESNRIKHSYNFQCSVDRINPELPYTKSNIHLISVSSNFAKHSLPHEAFLQFIEEMKMVDPTGHS